MGGSKRAAEDVREEVGTPSFTSASLFVALVLPMLPPIAPSLGTPSSASSPFPYLYRVIGMVMIAFVGVATFDKPETGATSILQVVIRVSPKHHLRNAIGSFLLLLRFLRSCTRRLCVHTWYSDSGGDLQDPQPHKGFPPHIRQGFVEEPIYARLSGVEKGSLLLLLLCAWASLTRSSHLPLSEVFILRSLRKKRKKRRK
jgi:hypothetical protein